MKNCYNVIIIDKIVLKMLENKLKEEKTKNCPYAGKFLEEIKEKVCTSGKNIIKKGNYDLEVIDYSLFSKTAAKQVCNGLYNFISKYDFDGLYNNNLKKCFFSYIAVFPNQKLFEEEEAAESFHNILYNMHLYDKSQGYSWSKNVSNNPKSKNFSYSIGSKSFFIRFFHQFGHSKPRQSTTPTLVFNFHELFEALRIKGVYDKIRNKYRKWHIETYGKLPGLLSDFENGLEYPQYLLPPKEKVDELVWGKLEEIAGKHPFGLSNMD